MKPFNEITYRQATFYDSIADIAKLIYLTDPYIYPSAFSSYDDKKWIDLVNRCLLDEKNFYFVDNLYVAEKNGKILALIVAVKNGKSYRFLPDSYEPSSPVQRMVEGYYSPLSKEILESIDGSTVVNFCTDISHQNKGIGKNLLKYYLTLENVSPTYLDVISDNTVAVNLYEKLGFNRIKSYLGFSGNEPKPINCYSMKRE